MDSGKKRKKFGFATIPVMFMIITLSISATVAVSAIDNFSAPKGEVQSIGANYWYVGAFSNGSNYTQNNGVRSEINVFSQKSDGALLGFWVSETMSNDLWAQVGYYIFHNSQPVAFYQVWNLTTRTEIASGTRAASSGDHLFSMSPKSGTIYEFSVDSLVIGYYNMKANTSSATDPVYALSEEGYCNAPFSFNPVTFNTLQVLKGDHWRTVASAQSYGNAWGIGGSVSESPNQLIVGGTYSPLNQGTLLW